MDHLPLSDAPMLASSINFLLRDREFDNLDDICSYFEVDRAEVEAILKSAGYSYDPAGNHVIF